MDLSNLEHQILDALPNASYDVRCIKNKADYIGECVSWGRENGHNATLMQRLARIKWQSGEVEDLISAIERDIPLKLKDAVIMLLKDRYVV